jgi:Holliday junction resolvasome RuvABC endonuclease subunit
MFVDPASISSGWALFRGKRLIAHGTIAVDKNLHWTARLHEIRQGYLKLPFTKIDEVHIERLVRRTHIYTHYSVGVIASVLCLYAVSVDAEVSITPWQKYVDWKGKRKRLTPYKKRVKSEDELAAIGMGLYWLSEKV